jgi:5-carboxymethyl-2-hydroxymuconic-semialdehyde dehydrogenase
VALTVEGVEISPDHWIGGQRVGSSEAFPDVSPIDEELIAPVSRADAREANAAVAAARGAFETWGRTPPQDRARILHAIGEGVQASVPELAAVETRDNGSTLGSMRNSVMPRVAHNFHFFADRLLELHREDFELREHTNRVSWDPSGVAVVVTPWNAPLMLATWRLAPALAAGNTVVFKPPEWAPLTASLLADIARDAGLPDGVLNVVQGIGEEAGAALVAHPDARARRQVGVRDLRRHGPGRSGEAGGRPVRQRGAGVPRRDAADRRGRDLRRVPRPVRRRRVVAASGRPA